MARSPAEYVPQLTSDRRPLLIWISVAAVTAIIMAMIIGAPLARAGGHQSLALVLYGVFARLCHQIPERSFFIAGHQFAVCSRCTGLYVGFTAVTFCYPLVRSVRRIDMPPRRWLFLAALPLIIDFGLGYFGLWENTHLSRFLTGALFGGAAVFYILPGLTQLNFKDLRELFHRKATVTQ
jgi:uncharacterized membrane protein